MLFVTGDTLSPDARQFLQDRDAPSLDKPFSKADLLARVAALLELSRRRPAQAASAGSRAPSSMVRAITP